MSWIEEVDLADQNLPEIFRVMSLNPGALELVKGLNEGLAFGGSGLTRSQEEAIATVVSTANKCRYGAMTHGGFLRRQAHDSQLAGDLMHDFGAADLSDADRAMLDIGQAVHKVKQTGYEHDRQNLVFFKTNFTQLIQVFAGDRG